MSDKELGLDLKKLVDSRKCFLGLNIVCPGCGAIVTVPPDMIAETTDKYGSRMLCKECGRYFTLLVTVDTEYSPVPPTA